MDPTWHLESKDPDLTGCLGKGQSLAQRLCFQVFQADIHRYPRGTKMLVHRLGSEDTTVPDAV